MYAIHVVHVYPRIHSFRASFASLEFSGETLNIHYLVVFMRAGATFPVLPLWYGLPITQLPQLRRCCSTSTTCNTSTSRLLATAITSNYYWCY